MDVRAEAAKVLKERKRQAVIGWRVWRRLQKAMKAAGGFDRERDVIVVAVPEDPDGEALALLHMEHFAKTYGGRVFFCSSNPLASKLLPVFFKDAVCLAASAEEIEALECLAQLVKFCGRLRFASVSHPFGRIGERMIGVKGITEDEVFAIGACSLWKYERPVLPGYSGENSDIRDYLKKAKRILKEKTDEAA
ncbi:MAG: hypothetical protein IJ573_10220 [Clostridia bacterium]|nr:hypothetical protein [Clostridia bacterium]